MCPGIRKQFFSKSNKQKITSNLHESWLNHGFSSCCLVITCYNFGMLCRSPPNFLPVKSWCPCSPATKVSSFWCRSSALPFTSATAEKKKNMAGPTIPCLRQYRRIGFPSSWIMIISNILASISIWVNYNISLTWNVAAIWGWFPLLTMIPVRSQWGRYNLPRSMYI